VLAIEAAVDRLCVMTGHRLCQSVMGRLMVWADAHTERFLVDVTVEQIAVLDRWRAGNPQYWWCRPAAGMDADSASLSWRGSGREAAGSPRSVGSWRFFAAMAETDRENIREATRGASTPPHARGSTAAGRR
jgi:hypothetical protein